jgi:hypothetical protein
MVTTTADSLKSLVRANVNLEGLQEGIACLERAVEGPSWYLNRPKHTRFLDRELLDLRTAVADAAQRQLAFSKAMAADLSDFIHASELRWGRDDEERFQAELVEWKKQLEPNELKIVRGLWKIFGAKAFEAVTAGVPVDFAAAAELAIEIARSQK